MRRRDRRGDGPDGSEPRTPAAAAVCAERGIARCLLLASPEEARAETRTLPDAVQAAQST